MNRATELHADGQWYDAGTGTDPHQGRDLPGHFLTVLNMGRDWQWSVARKEDGRVTFLVGGSAETAAAGKDAAEAALAEWQAAMTAAGVA